MTEVEIQEHRVRFASSCSEENANESVKVGVTFVEDRNRSENTSTSRLLNVPVIRCRGSGVTDADRQADFENALDWLRKELKAMQTQDRVLAKQLIGLRSKIQNITKENEEYFNEHELEITESGDTAN